MFRHLLIVAVGVIGVFAYALGSRADTPVVEVAPLQYRYEVMSTLPPQIDARAYLVADIETGDVLLQATATTPYPIASVTKLIVAGLLVATATDATTTITQADVDAPEPFGKLAVGEIYSRRELLFPYLLESSNDAGLALERLGGEALDVALRDVTYQVGAPLTLTDTTGLSSNNVASAEALLRATQLLWQEHPHIFDITRLPRYTTAYSTLVNNSPLIAMSGYRGGKHGYTPEAGRTVVGLFSITFGTEERTLVYVVLGTTDILSSVKALQAAVASTVTRVPATSAILPPSSVE